MRVASFNIYNGAQDTYPLIKDFVIEENIDVLCLQEANGWHEGKPTRIADFIANTGLTYAVVGGNREHKLVTFSNLPIIDSTVYYKGFWHGAVKALIKVDEDVVVPVTNAHLNPFDEDERLREAASLARYAGDGIIAMDSNSLAREDRYPQSLLQNFQAMGNKRYGATALRYESADYFARQGLIDAAAALKRLDTTFPARTDTEPHPQQMRLDRFYVPHYLSQSLDDIEVVKTPATRVISDHFPVVLTLNPQLAPVPVLSGAAG